MTGRDRKLDFYKGMLIWGVVWGHTITALLNGDVNDIGIHRIFRTYDMPFFMAISGFLFSFSMTKYRLGNLLLNKITTLALPAFLWALVFYTHSSPLGSFYFLWAVFWSALVVGLGNTIIRNHVLQIVVYSILTIGLHFLPVPSNTIYNLPYLFPFFIIGFYAWPLLDKVRNYVLFFALVFVLDLCFWKSSYNIWNIGANILNGGQVLKAVALRSVLALSGIVTIRAVFDILFEFLSNSSSGVEQWIEKFGRETLGIYILQEFVVFRLVAYAVQIAERHIGQNIFAANHLLLGYFIAPALSFIMLVFFYQLVSWCKSKKYLKYLWGAKI